MSCDKHVLNFRWEQHDWDRRVTATDCRSFSETSMWGRPISNDHVVCHVTFVCRTCGTTRDGGECGCDRVKGDSCPARLAFIEETNAALRARGA